MKLDILVICAHPDDAELCCGGTIIAHVKQNYKVGILDLTKGELGTRGNAETRLKEAEEASKILGISVRDNMGYADGFFQNDKEHQIGLIQKIRQYQPEIVITNPPQDRHPDHQRAAGLVYESCFLSGLRQINTFTDKSEEPQQVWRPKALYSFLQHTPLKPDFVVDIEPYIEQKFKAIKAYRSQFFDPDSKEPETILTKADFFEKLKARSQAIAHPSGLNFAEGFLVYRTPAVTSLFDLK